MDAQILRCSLILLSTFVFTGASYQTPNFTVTAPTAEIAEEIGKAAETYRRDLAIFWLDQPLPKWSRPCTLRVRPGSMGAGGETKFQFAGGEVMNWNMYVQGSMERILDSVLPHEVNHTIFACHFRRPLPRWADEGAATLFEHRSEQVKQLGLLNQVIKGNREFISLRNLLTMKEYPRGYRPMLILYAEGYALADFLVQQGGRKRYLKFLADGERMGWTQAIKANYHHGGVDSLQENWQSWVMAGMPKLRVPEGQMLADSRAAKRGGEIRPAILDEYPAASTIRSQSPEAAQSNRSSASSAPKRTGIRTVASQTEPRLALADTSPGKSGRPIAFERSQSSSTVFFGLPVTRPAKAGSQAKLPAVKHHHRDAAFEAPSPRATGSATTRSRTQRTNTTHQSSHMSDGQSDDKFHGLRQASVSPVSGFEPTKLSQNFNPSDPNSLRKHLPQERRMVTGSTPQWAGFPGQKELF